MELFDRVTRYRYQYPNPHSSVRFIDHMITGLVESKEYILPAQLETIDRVMRKVFGYSRYEPTNPYMYHKNVPSARNIHINEAFLILDGNICRFNGKRNCYEHIGYSREERGKHKIVVAAEPWRVMKFYGEFGLVLPFLDGGHILAQLKMELEAAGLTNCQVRYGMEHADLCEHLGMSKISNVICFEIELGDFEISTDTVMRAESSRRQYCYDQEVIAYEVSREILLQSDCYSLRPMICNREKINKYYDLKKRESAHSNIGIFSLTQMISSTVVTEYAQQLSKCMKHYMQDYQYFNVYIVYRTTQGRMVLEIRGGSITEPKAIDIDMNRLLYDTQSMINLESMPIVAYFSYQYQSGISDRENIFNSHIGAAELCHYFLLNGTRDNMFARPMRNLADEYVEEVFQVGSGERFVYSVMLGQGNTFNYCLHLVE